MPPALLIQDIFLSILFWVLTPPWIMFSHFEIYNTSLWPWRMFQNVLGFQDQTGFLLLCWKYQSWKENIHASSSSKQTREAQSHPSRICSEKAEPLWPLQSLPPDWPRVYSRELTSGLSSVQREAEQCVPTHYRRAGLCWGRGALETEVVWWITLSCTDFFVLDMESAWDSIKRNSAKCRKQRLDKDKSIFFL